MDPKSQAQCIKFLTLSLSLALSLLIFLCWTECCIVNKTPEYPRCRLELESLGWKVGCVKAVGSTLDGLWDQVGVFINLDGETMTQRLNKKANIAPKHNSERDHDPDGVVTKQTNNFL